MKATKEIPAPSAPSYEHKGTTITFDTLRGDFTATAGTPPKFMRAPSVEAMRRKIDKLLAESSKSTFTPFTGIGLRLIEAGYRGEITEKQNPPKIERTKMTGIRKDPRRGRRGGYLGEGDAVFLSKSAQSWRSEDTHGSAIPETPANLRVLEDYIRTAVPLQQEIVRLYTKIAALNAGVRALYVKAEDVYTGKVKLP